MSLGTAVWPFTRLHREAPMAYVISYNDGEAVVHKCANKAEVSAITRNRSGPQMGSRPHRC